MQTVKPRLIIALSKDTGKGLKSLPYKAIQLFTSSPYYHAELIIDDLWVSAGVEGMRIRPLKPLSDEWDYIDLGTIEILENNYRQILDFIGNQSHKKYDFLGIVFSQILPFSIDNPSKFFCSEIVSTLLSMFMIKEFVGIRASSVSPAYFSKVYKSKFKKREDLL